MDANIAKDEDFLTINDPYYRVLGHVVYPCFGIESRLPYLFLTCSIPFLYIFGKSGVLKKHGQCIGQLA